EVEQRPQLDAPRDTEVGRDHQLIERNDAGAVRRDQPTASQILGDFVAGLEVGFGPISELSRRIFQGSRTADEQPRDAIYPVIRPPQLLRALARLQAAQGERHLERADGIDAAALDRRHITDILRPRLRRLCEYDAMDLQQILPGGQYGVEVIGEQVCFGVVDVPSQVHGCYRLRRRTRID